MATPTLPPIPQCKAVNVLIYESAQRLTRNVSARLHRPWPALEEFANSIDLEQLDDAAHAHVPFGTATHLPICRASPLFLTSTPTSAFAAMRGKQTW